MNTHEVSRGTDNVIRYRHEAMRLLDAARKLKARDASRVERIASIVRLARDDFRHYLRYRK